MAGLGSGGILQLVRERRTRDALYHAADYWDARAAARSGMARSMWPSNVFNALWDLRQKELLVRAMGDVRGRRVADVGCGTGRMTRWLAGQGAREVVGFDFSPATVDAAREETGEALTVRFVVGDVVGGLPPSEAGFDDAVVLGCLSVACRDEAALRRALANVARLVRPGGRVVLLEPIHQSPLLRRVLPLGVSDWVAAANDVGLLLLEADCMGFAPGRLLLSVRDMPRFVVAPLFRAGEALLERAPFLAPLSDYKLLSFRHGGDLGHG